MKKVFIVILGLFIVGVCSNWIASTTVTYDIDDFDKIIELILNGEYESCSDINRDGAVNILDLSIVSKGEG